MYGRPDLDDSALLAAVREHWGIHGRSVIFLPLGLDSAASAFRVEADRGPLFLKVRRGPARESGLIVPRMLADAGVKEIVAPLPTRGGSLFGEHDRYTLTLQPFVDGRPGMDVGLSEAQWAAFGRLMRRIHDTPVMVATPIEPERLVPSWGGASHPWDEARAIVDRARRWPASASPKRELRDFWRDHAGLIDEVIDRARELAAVLETRRGDAVLCHADLHTGNVLVGADGAIRLIDWDEATIGRRERDLMFVVGGIDRRFVPAEGERAFMSGYGPIEIDREALAYYRYAWAVQDIASFTSDIVGDMALDVAGQVTALRYLKALFRPDAIIELARDADRHLARQRGGRRRRASWQPGGTSRHTPTAAP